MTDQPMLRLNDGCSTPQLGLGVWQTPADVTAEVVREALGAGYRGVDTAMVYRNEEGVGEGVRASALPRDELFVATKLWNEDHGYDSTLRAMDQSLARLGLDYVDLYLIHWPVPGRDRYVDSWRALVKLKAEGKARSIGVSNFTEAHLRRVIDATGVVPAVNQIELHPDFQQRALRATHEELGIVTESWSPLGRGKLFDHPVLQAIARKHGRTVVQVMIRWHLDNGLMVIPKSVTPSRLRENLAVFDFKLDADDLQAIAGMDDPAARDGPDPETFG